MNCPNCQTENPEGARFCFNCGTALALTCANCGTNLPVGSKFCFNCGHPTSTEAKSPPAPEPALAPPPTPVAQPELSQEMLQRYIPRELLSKMQTAQRSGLVEGERRIVTILFCDVKGSTAAASTLDPEEWAEIINGAFEYMINPIYHYEGTVARLMGDGLLAFFGAPIAHEDDPQRAVLAGLDIVEAIDAYCRRIHSQWGLQLSVRVGINTGLVVVGAVGSDLRVEYTALGDAINLAARMEQTAAPGTVQIAQPTYKLIAPLFDFEDLGRLDVKGKEEPVHAYRVIRAKVDPGSLRGISGLHAPLIGRQFQLDVLLSSVAELGQGSGQIVSLMGEAGLGKSRLITELRQEVAADPVLDALWVEGRSQSYETATPYAPFINLFNDYFELEADQPDETKIERIKARINSISPEAGPEMAPFIAAMMGLRLNPDDEERIKYLEPPQLRGMIFGNVSGLLEAQLGRQPIVMVLDDLHWADPTSLELLQSLVPLTERAPLMILAAFLPRRQEPAWAFHESAQRDYHYIYQNISLSPLDQVHSRELVARLLEVEDLPEKVRQAILDKSEGNPFFVEEIIRSLLDGGQIIRQDGHWRATQEINDIAIPDTLVGVITTRLDRLEEATRQIAQAAAVLGREFPFQVLQDMVMTSPELESAMVDLQRREIVREKSRLPERIYAFKHILTQQAAYDSILLSNRREFHRRAAEALTARQPALAVDIARHWIEARQPARAMPFLVEAGDWAARAYATAEAIDFYNQALSLRSSVTEISPVRQAYEGLGGVLSFANRIPEAFETYEALLAFGEEQGDVATQVSALNKLAATVGLRMGQFPQADQYLARADKLSKEIGDITGEAEMALIHCQMCTAQADFESVIERMGELAEIGERVGAKEYIALGLEHVASSLMWLARFDEAQQKAEEALTLSREINDREHEAWLLASTLPMCAIRNGDFEKAASYLEEGNQISTKIGAAAPQIIANWLRGEMAQWQGDYEQALTYSRQALETALPLEAFMPFMVVPPLGSMGSAYLNISDQFQEEVIKFHHHALRLLESPAGNMFGGTAWADLGFCALTLGDLELASESFDKGLNVPTMFMRVERPRLLAGSALLALTEGKVDKAVDLAKTALAYAEEKRMQNMFPITQLVLGKALFARDDRTAALKALEKAELEAQNLGMRPYIWQARLAAAEVLEKDDRVEEARTKRNEARAVIDEIAGLLQDETLREAYLRSAREKTGLVSH